ncbi:alpha/beta hydrolase [Poriferisphaera sp. WC338]|uniref:alpha/beta hydrolase n=1 Tax=Poriferisphaera sp. WC338 TaxID=3425129 RepID=UPI003D81AB9E
MDTLLGLLLLFFVAWLIIVIGGTLGLVWSLRHPTRRTFAVALGRGLATQPEELGLSGEEVNFSFADGSGTSGWILEGGKRDGPTVVVVHGYGDSKYGAMNGVGKVICDAKVAWKVVVFDLRGQGESEAKTCGLGMLEPADVKCVVEQLAEEDVKRGVVLFGYSMGAGNVIRAPEMCDDEDPCIIGVIAEGPYRFWDEPVRNVMRLKKYPTWPLVSLAGPILNRKLPGLLEMDREEDARKLTCPLLVLHGTQDVVCGMDTAESIAKAAEQGEFVAIDGAGHTRLAEHDPARYGVVLKKFFEALDQDGAAH